VNLIIFAPIWLAGLLLLALLAAAAEDVWRLRISNVTVLVVIAASIAAMAFEGFRGPLWQNGVIFVVIMFFNRDYAGILLDRPKILIGCLVSEGLGAIWIRKIVNFDF